ncbi:MAG: pyridoxal phosphate-dependent aminotransferase [Pseudomonadota bacterium]
MSDLIVERLKHIQLSPAMAIAAHATELKAAGIDIIDLSEGQPDFDTPEHIKQAGIKAITENFTRYTNVSGTLELRQAICNKLKRDNQLDYQPAQILVSCGAKHSIYNAYQALLNPDDEVIIQTPYWPSYVSMAWLAQAKPVIVETSFAQNYKMTAEQLEKAITPKTKLLILCSPSISGTVYSHAELQALAEVLIENPHVYIISDDIYESIYWADEPFRNLVMQNNALYDRAIVTNGVSKAYAMTGWRIGYAAGPQTIIDDMRKLQSHSTSNATSIAQIAAQAALEGSQECVAKMTQVYHERQKIVLAALNAIDGFCCNETQGAFYFFVEVSQAIKKFKLKDDVEFSQLLLKEAKVTVVPGSGYGLPNHIRISYATSEALLIKALQRIKQLCRN